MSFQRLPMADAPPLPPLVRYPRTGTFRRCAGIECGALKPAAAFERGDGRGFYHYCDTCRIERHESRDKERIARLAAVREARFAARRKRLPEQRAWLQQLRTRGAG